MKPNLPDTLQNTTKLTSIIHHDKLCICIKSRRKDGIDFETKQC